MIKRLKLPLFLQIADTVIWHYHHKQELKIFTINTLIFIFLLNVYPPLIIIPLLFITTYIGRKVKQQKDAFHIKLKSVKDI